MRSSSEKKVVEKIKTIPSSTIFSENRALYETVCKNIVETDKPQMTT
jgi:hypothetical protein